MTTFEDKVLKDFKKKFFESDENEKVNHLKEKIIDMLNKSKTNIAIDSMALATVLTCIVQQEYGYEKAKYLQQMIQTFFDIVGKNKLKELPDSIKKIIESQIGESDGI